MSKTEQLAQELIKEVRAQLAPEAATLQWRIREALVYMRTVEKPNAHTLAHVRRYLTGEYDGMPPQTAE